MSFGLLADASNAVSRLQEVFEAELVTESLAVDPSLPHAVEVKNASFVWDVTPPDATDSADSSTPSKSSEPAPAFTVRNINLTIPRGSMCAIVGLVGAGKTSLLQGLVGEMRRTEGQVAFGGSVAYCSQVPWIQNTSIRENVCFGRPFEEAKYWKAVKDACLEIDFDALPNGDLTEVGEKVCCAKTNNIYHPEINVRSFRVSPFPVDRNSASVLHVRSIHPATL